MKKILITAAATLAAISATAQNSSSTTNQSTTTAEAVAPKKENPWGFSMLTMVSAMRKNGETHFLDATENPNSDQYDPTASKFDSEFHFKLSYKLKDGKKLTVNQRLFYSYAAIQEQDNKIAAGQEPILGMTRLEFSDPVSIGSGSALITRLTLPVSYEQYLENELFGLAEIASLNWDLNPKVSIGITSYNGMSLKGGNRRGVAYYNQSAANLGAINLAKKMAATGPQRDWAYFDNQVAVNYNISDKFSISQSFGYGFGLTDMSNNFANFERTTALWELGTELAYQATKSVGIAVGLSQQIADMPGAADLSTGKAVYYSGYKYSLYRPEETTMYANANIVF